MATVDFGSAENLVRIGLGLVFAAIALLQGAFLGEAATMFLWMALAILFFETFRLPSVSVSNAAMAELIFAVAMVAGGIKGLILSMGKSFAANHFFLIVFIIGAAIICFSAYKRLCPTEKRK